mgnify:FL=1
MGGKKIKVAVLMGGPSAEHEVSLASGRKVLKHLDAKKYFVEPVTVSRNGKWLLPDANRQKIGSRAEPSSAWGGRALAERAGAKKLAAEKADVVFIALHGAYGEDGTVQGLLETFGIPYTGSGVLASALGMDKPRSLAVFREAGLAVPDFVVARARDVAKERGNLPRQIAARFEFPLVVKPANHGSSVGVSIVKKRSDIARALGEAGKYSQEVIIQKFIRGRELTCGVLERRGKKLQALPPVEIIPKLAEFYDYRSKYADKGSEHIIPPPGIANKTIAAVEEAACAAHTAIGARGMSRSDFILGEDGILYILEINTIPGMPSTSLLPQAAAAAGIPFPRLLDVIIRSALK